ncbi:DNA-binding protein [Burkholderia latens]|uniref:DNA-binding protein n=1 Tax=Burkholderia latens TaxID=488446 RepID=A0AAP1G8N0_9BURK|nr:PLP-dependent aminotransferase family protein [Burkholderia latens]KVA10699.1 DNA-binding protein [Burkholderia latens]
MPAKASLLSELLLQKRAWVPGEHGGTSMHRELYELIKSEILEGTLPGGSRLPPSRVLGWELGISRNTVLNAYDQLLAEGYVTATTGRGTFVTDVPSRPTQHPLVPPPSVQPFCTADYPSISSRGTELLTRRKAADQQWGAFVAGVPDVTLFPRRIWQRLLNRHWRQPSAEMLSYSTVGGLAALRRTLAEHLHLVRSVQCDPEQIVITSGIHQAIDVIARLLGDPGDCAWVEDPGYWGMRSVLSSTGIDVVPVPVDDHGMSPTEEQLDGPAPRFICTTPSHQYPLGMAMSLPRRLMLIDYARRNDCWIIEDDYDSEFRFQGRPLASLQGLDTDERVIYVGTFSKTLFPGMRIGYMVLPKSIARYATQALAELYREGQLIQQAALADFMIEGHYAAHIRRVREVYARRHDLLRHSIARHLGRKWPVASQDAGLHLALLLPDDVDDVEISNQVRTRGIAARPLTYYYLEPHNARKGLLLGYACVPDNAIDPGVQIIASVIRQNRPIRGRLDTLFAS